MRHQVYNDSAQNPGPGPHKSARIKRALCVGLEENQFFVAYRLAFSPAGSLSLGFPLRSLTFRLALGLAFRLTLGLFLGLAFRLTLGNLPLSLLLGLALRLTLGLFLGFAFRLALCLFLGFAFRLAFGLLLGLALGYLPFSFFLGFLFGLALGDLPLSLFLGFLLGLAFGYFLFSLTLRLPLRNFPSLRYAAFRRFLPRYLTLLRDLALRSFSPRLFLGSHQFSPCRVPGVEYIQQKQKIHKVTPSSIGENPAHIRFFWKV